MTNDEQIIKAALDMAAMAAVTTPESRPGAPREWSDGFTSGCLHSADAIRAINPAEVLAKVGGDCSEENRQNDQQMLGGTVVICREEITPDAVARLMEAGNDLAPWISASMSDPYTPACEEYLKVAESFLKALAAMETSHD